MALLNPSSELIRNKSVKSTKSKVKSTKKPKSKVSKTFKKLYCLCQVEWNGDEVMVECEECQGEGGLEISIDFLMNNP